MPDTHPDTHRVKVTLLGTGSSGGVPRVGGEWGACNPNTARNRRSRCSILVEQWVGNSHSQEPPDAEKTIILVDTSPDLRMQLLNAGTKHINALFYTHDHADQTHGIDDVRALAYGSRTQIPTFMDEHTKQNFFNRFRYCFETPKGRVHPPILQLEPLFSAGDRLEINGAGGVIDVDVLGLSHGPTPVNGFIFNQKAAYTPDVWMIDDATLGRLSGLDMWIIDALRYNEHPTHAHLDRTFSWLARTKIRQGILTNLHIDMDYDTLSAELPGPHIVGYDGMELSFPTSLQSL